MLQWDRFVAGKAYRRGTVLAIGTGIGKGVQINALHNAVLRGTQPHMDLHFVTRRGCDLAFHTTENDLGGLFGLPSHRRIREMSAAVVPFRYLMHSSSHTPAGSSSGSVVLTVPMMISSIGIP